MTIIPKLKMLHFCREVTVCGERGSGMGADGKEGRIQKEQSTTGSSWLDDSVANHITFDFFLSLYSLVAQGGIN